MSGKKIVPVRLNMKPVTEEARTPTKLPAQRTGQPMQSANTSATVPTKEAREEEERGSLLPPPAPPTEGQYELSPLMTRMVESELKNVMIKVWQALPDNPASESDKHVVDKFRSTAGDDLMNVLGFNITQRLLNVYNPLSFKITFTGKPDKADLAAFLRKYNFIIFRRITTSINSFYAQVRTVADFDRLWAAKIVRCGKIRVAVKSLYKFSQCPKNLQTSFHGHGQMKEILNSDQKCNEKHTQDNSEDTLSNKSESEKKDIPIKHEKVEITVTPKEIKPVEVKSASKQNINIKKDEVKPTEKDKTDKEKTKPAEVAKQTKATVTENKSKGSQISTTKVKVTASGTGKKIEDAKTMKQSEAKKIDDKSKNTILNPNEKSNKAQPRQIAEIKPEKLQSNLNSNTKSVTLNKSPRTADAKVIKKSSVPVSQNRPNAPEKKANDFDELDDYDILALMSEGIVLDECTGSDEE